MRDTKKDGERERERETERERQRERGLQMGWWGSRKNKEVRRQEYKVCDKSIFKRTF